MCGWGTELAPATCPGPCVGESCPDADGSYDNCECDDSQLHGFCHNGGVCVDSTHNQKFLPRDRSQVPPPVMLEPWQAMCSCDKVRP